MMNASVRYSSNSNLNKQIKKLPSESEDLAAHNIFKIIASICNACVGKICEFLPLPSVPTFDTACKPCNYDECISYVDHIENDSIELRLLYENKIHEELDHVKYKNDSSKLCYACHCPNNQPKSITYAPWQQMAGKNPAFGNSRQIDLRQLSQPGIPIEKYIEEFHSASIENYPFSIQAKHVDVYDPICDKVCYFCGRCECNDQSQMEWYLKENLKLQKLKCTGSSVCKCSLCECLSCPFRKKASFAESLENYESNVRNNYIENKWKGRLRCNKQEIQACRTPKDFRHFRDSTKIFVGKLSKEKCSVQCSKRGHVRKTWQCSQKNSTIDKIPVKKILDDVCGSDFDIEKNDNISTVNPNRILTDQLLKNMYGEYTVMNHETNTENFTTDKCTETDNLLANKKSCAENNVKNYEYILKIEITTPHLDKNIKQDMKQRIKRASKNKIKEHTKKVMEDVMKDISNNSLLHEMFRTENPTELQPLDSKTPADMEPQELCKIRSIVKKNSTVSLKSTTTENQNSSNMVTALPRSKGSKMEDFFVGCVTPLKKTSRRTGNDIDANDLELPSRDESALSQNNWSPVPPAQLSLRTQLHVTEKLVSCVDAPTADVNKSGKCLDDLRVQEPCLRRVSNHTVSLKWRLPKLIEEIMGYEILVDGKIIEKILNPKRCLAVVSCLPPVRRLMITIRTLPKSPSLRGLYPCTTIGYQPRANKCIRF